jgi:hypothetical protein
MTYDSATTTKLVMATAFVRRFMPLRDVPVFASEMLLI